MGMITVNLGDSVPSIAKQNGFFWETLWNHGQNAALKSKRKDPNILFPGDQVFVPDRALKEENRPTNARHKFKLKGEQVKFKLQLLMLGEPRKNEPYTLQLDGKVFQGTTDGDGKIELKVPADAQSGTLILRGGKEKYPVNVGHLNPIDEISGVQQRLNNLGFQAGAEDGQQTDTLKAALIAFQTKYKLNPTGDIDGATKAKLLECHP
jgi:Putative peptidoglycan binding domain